MLTDYFFIIDFDWISGAMSLSFIQCSTIISYTIFIGCLTVRFDLSDYRLTAHVTYGIQCLCSFVILCGRQFSNIRQPSVDKPTLMTQNVFQICQVKSVLAILQYSSFLFQNFLCFLALIIQPTAAYALIM